MKPEKYKLFIRKYDITKNDYVVVEEVITTCDIYHEIGKIYCTSIEEIPFSDNTNLRDTRDLIINQLVKAVKKLDKDINYIDN